jgi:integrase
MSARRHGSIRPRGDRTWQLVIEAPPDPRTGARRQKTRTFRGTEREAERELARMVAEAPHLIEPARMTVAELLDEWLAVAGPDMSPGTLADYHRYIDAHLRPHLGTIRLDKLTSGHLDRLYAQLRHHGRQCRRRPKCTVQPCPHGGGGALAAGSVKRVHTIIHAALEQAIHWEWLQRNPARGLGRRKHNMVRRAKPVSVPGADVAAVTAWLAVNDPELWTFVVLASRRGARPGEICALRWTDVDLDAGTITFARNIARGAGGAVEKPTKTDRERTVRLAGAALDAVQAHRRYCAERALALGVGLAPESHLFVTGMNGRPWRPDTATTRRRRACEKAGVTPFTFRQLRHYVATTLITNGMDPTVVAGILGHSSAKTTLDVYSDWVPARDDEAVAIIDADLNIADDG